MYDGHLYGFDHYHTREILARKIWQIIKLQSVHIPNEFSVYVSANMEKFGEQLMIYQNCQFFPCQIFPMYSGNVYLDLELTCQ